MDIYQYLVEVVKQVEGGWELPLNKEVSLSKDSSGVVELVICSDWVDCTIPIESIKSRGDSVLVNDKILVGVTHDGFLEFYLESEPYEFNRVSIEFVGRLIQDCKINFTISSKEDTIYFFDDHTAKYGLSTFDLSNSKVRYERTVNSRMIFDLGNGVELSIPNDARVIIDLND